LRRIAVETVALIRTMACENALWGAERIRGELLKLGIKASKRTVQKYMCAARPQPPGGPRWSTFLRNHACDVATQERPASRARQQQEEAAAGRRLTLHTQARRLRDTARAAHPERQSEFYPSF
jgi:hypothetical protein